jgi:hypothetical protein
MAPVSDIERAELPTLERLGLSAPPEVCPAVVAHVVRNFCHQYPSERCGSILSQLVDDAFWRDMLAFTWNFPTFYCRDRIRQFLDRSLSDPKALEARTRRDFCSFGKALPGPSHGSKHFSRSRQR